MEFDLCTGRDVQTDQEVAIKLEHHSTGNSLLTQEADIYKSLSGRAGIPQVFWYGYHQDYRILVLELLGPNLEDLFRYCGGRFSMKTTLMLMDQLLRRIECLHTTDHHHCDIKPENFLLGTGRRGNVVYVTDLGLANHRSAWCDSIRPCDPSQTPRLSLVGTCRYASMHGHLDVGQYLDLICSCPFANTTSIIMPRRSRVVGLHGVILSSWISPVAGPAGSQPAGEVQAGVRAEAEDRCGRALQRPAA